MKSCPKSVKTLKQLAAELGLSHQQIRDRKRWGYLIESRDGSWPVRENARQIAALTRCIENLPPRLLVIAKSRP